MKQSRLPGAWTALFIISGCAWGQSPEVDFFEQNIRPVLAKSCYSCHSSATKTAMSGLYLDSRDGLRRGGKSGPAIVPGRPEESLLIHAIRYENRKMPPAARLPASVIANFEKWIEMGAPDPRKGPAAERSTVNIEAGRKFWAFQPVKKETGTIDLFLSRQREQKGVRPVTDADRSTWLRRVTFDLTGLPPTPEEIAAFLADGESGAYARVVDRLLASEHYGERWGRYWLDVARFAESVGRGRNYAFPYAWHYRNYVIDSFNRDKPYDRFIREQIAGDLLPAKSPEQRDEQVIAAGFLALGAHELIENNKPLLQMDTVEEQINATTRAFLALTVGCARCHDHKFDPIPTTDYYALAGIFRSTEILSGLRKPPRGNISYFNPELLVKLSVPGPEKPARVAALQAEHQKLLYGPKEDPPADLALKEKARLAEKALIEKVLEQLDEFPLPANYAMSVRDTADIADCELNIHGEVDKLGPKIPRGVVQVVSLPGEAVRIGAGQSGRLQLAEWIARPENPLTARVMVNRIWQQLFGRGLVGTTDNFGAVGERPSHPELLDYLANQFVDQGWSVKKIIREIALSKAYQLSSVYDTHNAEIDPDNRLLWRMNRRRLDVEAIRDAVLTISGQIDFSRPEASPVFGFRRQFDIGRNHGTFPKDYSLSMRNRSVYVPVLRAFLPAMYEIFDFPEPSETKGSREVTTVPTQALFLLNSPFMMQQSRHAAERLVASGPAGGEDRVKKMYVQVLGRLPDAEDLKWSLSFVKAAADDQDPAWAQLYQALFASAEFRYRD